MIGLFMRPLTFHFHTVVNWQPERTSCCVVLCVTTQGEECLPTVYDLTLSLTHRFLYQLVIHRVCAGVVSTYHRGHEITGDSNSPFAVTLTLS